MPHETIREVALGLVAGVDYVRDGNRLVFTESYLLRRGQCCGSGCKNCPYPVEEAVERSITATDFAIASEFQRGPIYTEWDGRRWCDGVSEPQDG